MPHLLQSALLYLELFVKKCELVVAADELCAENIALVDHLAREINDQNHRRARVWHRGGGGKWGVGGVYLLPRTTYQQDRIGNNVGIRFESCKCTNY